MKYCEHCAVCGTPVDGPYCHGCTRIRTKFEKDLFAYCVENEVFQNFQDTPESSNDNTNVVNAPREPSVVDQDTVIANCLQSLLEDLQILNEIQPLKQETPNQIQKDQEEKSIVELLAEERFQKDNQEEIDIDFRRKCEDKIYELKEKFNGLSIEIGKITQEAKELRESEARVQSRKIIIDDDDDDLGFYAVHPNTISHSQVHEYTCTSSSLSPRKSLKFVVDNDVCVFGTDEDDDYETILCCVDFGEGRRRDYSTFSKIDEHASSGEISHEEEDTFKFTTRTFLPFVTYPEVLPVSYSTGSEDKVFNPGIFDKDAFKDKSSKELAPSKALLTLDVFDPLHPPLMTFNVTKAFFGFKFSILKLFSKQLVEPGIKNVLVYLSSLVWGGKGSGNDKKKQKTYKNRQGTKENMKKVKKLAKDQQPDPALTETIEARV
ncbi:hypothetical protein Tco_1301905 [Tanacetum coccineum]